jgi:hypothetical protein
MVIECDERCKSVKIHEIKKANNVMNAIKAFSGVKIQETKKAMGVE